MSVELTWYGHATWMLSTAEHKILVDPFFADNPATDVDPADIEADFVLITHGHFDHVADAASITNRCGAKLVANYEIATWFAEKHGVADPIGMNLGGTVSLPFGSAKMTLAHHSSQLPDGSYGGNPGGFVVETSGRRIYFAGDTALFSDMSLIGNQTLDAAILPIGDLFTMGIDDSVKATRLLSPKVVVPGHYNTWPPIEQDCSSWAKMISDETDARPVVLGVGETVAL